MKKLTLIATQIAVIAALSILGQTLWADAQTGNEPTLDERVLALETEVAGARDEYSALATRVAMLETQVAKLAATPTPLPATPTAPPKGTAARKNTTTSDDDALFEILNVDAKITESNKSWWKFSWILELENKSDETLKLSATIQFLDDDGFVVEEDLEYGIILLPKETKKVTGYSLVDSGAALTISGINAEVLVISSN